jgi:hypothetical protein
MAPCCYAQMHWIALEFGSPQCIQANIQQASEPAGSLFHFIAPDRVILPALSHWGGVRLPLLVTSFPVSRQVKQSVFYP